MRLGSSEANDVSVSEVKGNTEETVAELEIGYEAFRFSVEGQ